MGVFCPQLAQFLWPRYRWSNAMDLVLVIRAQASSSNKGWMQCHLLFAFIWSVCTPVQLLLTFRLGGRLLHMLVGWSVVVASMVTSLTGMAMTHMDVGRLEFADRSGS